jgi:hypothetical protein
LPKSKLWRNLKNSPSKKEMIEWSGTAILEISITFNYDIKVSKQFEQGTNKQEIFTLR